MAPTDRLLTLWRVRWRHSTWQASTSGRTRYFTRGADACRFADRVENRGATVEVARADQAVRFENVNR